MDTGTNTKLLEEWERIIEKAKKENLLIRMNAVNVILTPDQLKEAQKNGRYIWGTMNYSYVKPKDKIRTIKEKIKSLEEEIEYYYNVSGKEKMEFKNNIETLSNIFCEKASAMQHCQIIDYVADLANMILFSELNISNRVEKLERLLKERNIK